MTKTINNRKNMTTQELEAVSGGVVPWAAISVGIAAAKLTYDLSYAAGNSPDISQILRMITHETYHKSNK